jgi:4-amino-4-deoxy-L-arabinose transferase-like glycosyltransferase
MAALGSGFWRSPHGAALVFLAVPLLFGFLGEGSLANGDDAVYAWAARRLVQDGSWFDYRWHDADLFAFYPPLHFLLLRVSVTLLGATELAFRLPAALSALAVVLLVAELTWLTARSRNAALLAGLLLLCSGRFYASSRSVQLDMTYLAFGVAAYWAYVRAHAEARYFWLLGLFGGLAYLTKSLMTAFVAVPIVLHLVLFRRQQLRERALHGALLLALALAAPWHIALYLQGKPVFAAHSGRIMQGISHNLSLVHALGQLHELERYTVLVWLGAVVMLVQAARRSLEARLWLLALVSGVALLVASRTVLDHYTLSLFPPLAIGAGLLAGRLVDLKPVTGPLAAVLALALFVTNNAASWIVPDFAPGAREIAGFARERGSAHEVLFFRDYGAAFDFYYDGPTLIVTESKLGYERYIAHPAALHAHLVALVPAAQMFARLSEPGAVVVTTLPFQGDLEAYLSKLPAAQQARIERKTAGGYLLYRYRDS